MFKSSSLKGIDKQGWFSAHFEQGDNVWDVLFACLYTIPLLQKDSTLQWKLMLTGVWGGVGAGGGSGEEGARRESFLVWVDHFSKWSKYSFDTVVFFLEFLDAILEYCFVQLVRVINTQEWQKSLFTMLKVP